MMPPNGWIRGLGGGDSPRIALCSNQPYAPAAESPWSAKRSPIGSRGAMNSMNLRTCRAGLQSVREVWLEAEVGQLIDKIIQQHLQPKRYHQVPVFSLAEFSL